MARKRRTRGSAPGRAARGGAAATVRGGRRAPARRGAAPRAIAFRKTNAILLAAGLTALALGYWLLARGDITAAPLLLVLGYVVLLPMAIIR